MPDELKNWHSLWARFYANRSERDQINQDLVKEKSRLRQKGISPAQPAEDEVTAASK